MKIFPPNLGNILIREKEISKEKWNRILKVKINFYMVLRKSKLLNRVITKYD